MLDQMHGLDDLRHSPTEDALRRQELAAELLRRCGVEDGDAARLGARLRVEDLDSGRRLDYVLVAPFARAGRGTVSLASPVGVALATLEVGAAAAVPLGDGRTRRLRLLAVDPRPGGHNGM